MNLSRVQPRGSHKDGMLVWQSILGVSKRKVSGSRAAESLACVELRCPQGGQHWGVGVWFFSPSGVAWAQLSKVDPCGLITYALLCLSSVIYQNKE